MTDNTSMVTILYAKFDYLLLPMFFICYIPLFIVLYYL